MRCPLTEGYKDQEKNWIYNNKTE